MPKKIYYISVGPGTIEDQQTLADQRNYTYDYQVEASEEEYQELRRLLQSTEETQDGTFARAPIPYKSADHDPATEQFNDRMKDLYTLLYRLGTAETKGHIEKMGILKKLGNTDYDLPGYSPDDANEAIDAGNRR
ncbi:hypothetical protein [Paenibacillus mucilaginosus]|uniref:Uncharacterized protein n=1 Tax=Paenibacillus mucilaginosus (strain KNP414) TaxID=1036673 RepID=F8F7N4_PAEMK|nr:hypothetical protein [Paenibacillus mucilaginosus]AEI39519.1 hypothetical protein KNP414_00929 [Paenibacillus mucilaginosus KNP414]MCG7214661.1 hypothetical protein [Paenibacillus mucilaginosus]WDM28478.1 hypothetical protein KCX80_04330 [Paenibacillus mucilaginosus]